MEDTRLTHYYRIKKMIALMATVFCWAHKTGEWSAKIVKPLKIKNMAGLRKVFSTMGWIIWQTS